MYLFMYIICFFADWNFTVDSVYYSLLTSLLSWTDANDNIVHNINSNGYLWYHARHLSVVKIKEQEIEVTVSLLFVAMGCNVTRLDVLIYCISGFIGELNIWQIVQNVVGVILILSRLSHVHAPHSYAWHGLLTSIYSQLHELLITCKTTTALICYDSS